MKRNTIIFMLVVIFSCHGNPLKTNQDKLEQELLTAEGKKEQLEKEREVQEKKLADSLAKLPKGFRFKENRAVDPANPPMVIDIAGNLDNVKEFKLSDVASEIQYIRIEKVPDPTFPREMKYKYYLLDDYIVALNYFGIQLFDKNGKFIRTIVKNEITDVDYNAKKNSLIIMDNRVQKGGGVSVWGHDNKLFYAYSDNVSGKNCIMEYDCSSIPTTTNNKFDPEKPAQILGLGKVVLDLQNQKTELRELKKGDMIYSFYFTAEAIYHQFGNFLLDRNTCLVSLYDNQNILGLFNNRGDTLTTFSLVEKSKNFKKPPFKTPFTDGVQYENKGNMYYRSSYNDTVFQVIPPNRLLPVYVLNLGKYKVSKENGRDPNYDLTGKIAPIGLEWADTREYIFLKFTKDSYDKKKKKAKIYYVILSKAKRQLYIIKSDPYDYSNHILENNIDGGLAVWPLSYMIGNNNEILVSLKGIDLKDHVKSKQFINSTVSAAKKDKLKKLANEVLDSEDILMIVK